MNINIEGRGDKFYLPKFFKNLFDNNFKKHLVPILFLFILVIGLGFATFLVQRQQNIRTRATGSNSSIGLPSQKSVLVGSQFEVPIMIDNDNSEVIGADVIIDFDKTLLQLLDIIPNTQNNNLNYFLPLDANNSFNKSRVVSEANSSGKINFSALCYLNGPCYAGLNNPLTETNPLAKLTFKALALGSTSVNLYFTTQGNTTDSNLALRTAQDILGHVTNLSLSMVTPTPSPTITPTSTPVPTNTPIPIPTNTPTPTLIPTSTPTPTITPTPTSPTLGNGLTAQYYSYKNIKSPFTTLLVARIDPTINFIWQLGSPDPKIPADKFSARWTGKITVPTTGTYTIYARSDDGIRVWINNQLIIDRWVNQTVTETSGSIVLNAGIKYDFKVEYYDATGDAQAQLFWSSPSQVKQIIPQSQLFSQ